MQSSTAEMPMRALKNILKIEGPPGSGKTRALACEACRLTGQEGLQPSQLLLLAMTPLNKKRLSHYLKLEARQAGLSDATIPVLIWEEWLLGLLKEYGTLQDQATQLLSDTDARVLLQEILRQVVQPDHLLYYASRQASFARVFFELIRQLQLHNMSPEALAAIAREGMDADSRLPLVAKVFKLFIQHTSAVGLLCQAELASRVLAILSQRSADVAMRFSVILVDDAQELSEEHYRCLALLTDCLVLAGQEQLSIRSFRGAKPEIFANLDVYGQSPVTFFPQQACMRNNEAILSLLNTFLPQPIWEEQSPNITQLQELVQFGLYADPEQEADGVARFIEHFVQTRQVDDRPASWDDCVILLRSSHYQPHVVHALAQRGIPFRMEAISDGLLHFQHAFYDLLCVLDGWKKLGITPALLRDPVAFQTHCEKLTLPIVEQWDVIQLNNRHLLRWLDTMLHDGQETMGSANLQGLVHPESETSAFQLLRLLDPQAYPSNVLTVVQALFALYETYWNTACPVSLLEGALQCLESNSDTAAASELDADKASLLAGIEAFRENLERLNGHYQSTFGQPLPLSELLNGFHALWQGMDSRVSIASANGAVRLLSIHQVQGEEFPCVAIPFLVSGEFPYTREMPQVLSAADEARLEIPLAYQIDEAEEARLLAVGLSRATHKVLLGCHELEADTPVLPSAFYQKLLNGRRALTGQTGSARLCIGDEDCDFYACHHHLEVTSALADLEKQDSPWGRYTGESKWAALLRESALPLFAAEETLYLSASSIKTYMKCPRQFYYRHLLRLPQPGNEAASLGSLIHRVMEVFNLQAKTQPYTASRLKALAAAMFLFEDDTDAFFQAGFRDEDLHELRKLSPLTLSSLKQRLLDSIDDLERKGYFERYGNMRQIQPEKVLEGFQLDGLERCRFSGVMDAVVQLADGSWDIIDYKTFRSAYSVGLETCDKRFLETLDPLPEDEDLSHAERFADKLSGAYPKDYQLPLYYLACSPDPAYKEGVSAVTLQVMRPAFPDNPNQGAIRLQIPGSEIEASKQQMIQDIRRFIVEPILGSAVFTTSPGRLSCGSCGYYGICEIGDGENAGGEE